MVHHFVQAQGDFIPSIVRDTDIIPEDSHACVTNEMGMGASLRPLAGFCISNASGPPPFELD
eukprot:5639796-Alexandrium_andersonii.AAC.1